MLHSVLSPFLPDPFGQKTHEQSDHNVQTDGEKHAQNLNIDAFVPAEKQRRYAISLIIRVNDQPIKREPDIMFIMRACFFDRSDKRIAQYKRNGSG